MKTAVLFAALAASLTACGSTGYHDSDYNTGARMAQMITRDEADCAQNLPGACMRYQFDSQAVLQFLAPVEPTAYSLTVNRGFGW